MGRAGSPLTAAFVIYWLLKGARAGAPCCSRLQEGRPARHRTHYGAFRTRLVPALAGGAETGCACGARRPGGGAGLRGAGAPGASALPSLALGQRGSGVSGGRTWGRWTHVPRVPSCALRWVFSGQRAAPQPDVHAHSDSDAAVGRGSPDPACRAREGPRPPDWPRGSHALHAPDDFSSSVRAVTVQREGSQGFGVTHVTHFSSPSSHL